MGGNALKNVKTRRYQREEYFNLSKEVTEKLGLYWDKITVIPAYSTKPDFGDMDVLVSNNQNNNQKYDLIKELFSPSDIVPNGDVTSFDYKQFQIDLIFTDPNFYDFSLGYFSYNDLGNFIGRTAKRIGFKFGHNGLLYTFRDPENDTRMIKEILITQDFNCALSFLGFDPEKHKEGFSDPDEIFAYSASSPLFDPAQFLLHNRSYAARKRDSTRKMYNLMLKWIQQKYPNLPPDAKPLPRDYQLHLCRAFDAFPEFKKQYQLEVAEFELNKRFKDNFNGDNYREWFGIEDKELGVLMKKHREYFEQHNLKKWIAELDVESFKKYAISILKI